MVIRTQAVWLSAFLALACNSGLLPARANKRMLVPEEMRRPARPSEGKGGGSERTVLRLAERGRIWEVDLPEGHGGYEVRVPLDEVGALTAADQEMLADALGRSPDGGSPGGSARSLPKRSYLQAMANVNALYGQRKHELALIELVNLEKDYPQEARLFAMKGSLYLKLGKKKLAKEAWEKALGLSPGDLALAEALRELSQREE